MDKCRSGDQGTSDQPAGIHVRFPATESQGPPAGTTRDLRPSMLVCLTQTPVILVINVFLLWESQEAWILGPVLLGDPA